MSDKVISALNDQVKAEIYSAHLYLSMSAYFHSIDMAGAGNWMRIQYQEELFHAHKLFDYIIERGGRAKLAAIDEPPAEWKSPLDVFESALAHEKKVTAMIGNLLELARQEHDHATEIFLHWFINEQVEEEASASAIVQQFKQVGDSVNGTFMIDRELASRVYHPPVDAN